MEDISTAYYLRMQASDKPGVMADITRILGDADISIEAILQKEPAAGAERASVILLTHVVRERAMNRAISQIEALDSIDGAVTRIRLEHLNVD
jgi:homoserine dehydrogenase